MGIFLKRTFDQISLNQKTKIMHENLSSTVCVRANHNAFTGEKDGNNHWQCIASGERFNSFFVLYAKFRGEIKEGLFQPQECDFYLQTFEGNLTIGLTRLSKQPIDLTLAYHILLEDFVYILPIELEVLNDNIFIKECPLQIKADSSYECLSDDAKARVNILKNGIPEGGKLVVDMTFSDMSTIEIVNRNGKKRAFNDTYADSPIINGDKYIREGSQLFERNYQIHNPPEYSSILDNPDLNPDCEEKISKNIEGSMHIEWTSPINYNSDQGLVYGLGCHPYICKIVF